MKLSENSRLIFSFFLIRGILPRRFMIYSNNSHKLFIEKTQLRYTFPAFIRYNKAAIKKLQPFFNLFITTPNPFQLSFFHSTLTPFLLSLRPYAD